MFDAVGGNDGISGFSDSDATLAQQPVVIRGLDRQSYAEQLVHGQGREQFPGLPVVCIMSKALQNFGEDEIAYGDRFDAQDRIEIVGLGGNLAIEVCDPNAGVDKDHGLHIKAHAIQVITPFKLAPKPPQRLLFFQLDQRPQAEFDRFLLGFGPSYLDGVTDQFVVDYDIGSHSRFRVYVFWQLYTSGDRPRCIR